MNDAGHIQRLEGVPHFSFAIVGRSELGEADAVFLTSCSPHDVSDGISFLWAFGVFLYIVKISLPQVVEYIRQVGHALVRHKALDHFWHTADDSKIVKVPQQGFVRNFFQSGCLSKCWTVYNYNHRLSRATLYSSPGSPLAFEQTGCNREQATKLAEAQPEADYFAEGKPGAHWGGELCPVTVNAPYSFHQGENTQKTVFIAQAGRQLFIVFIVIERNKTLPCLCISDYS